MDFLDCPDCHERYVVQDAAVWDERICRDCGAELRLVAEGLTGSEQIEEAIHSSHPHLNEPSP
jgi:transcription initiation factor IIE alpha subunit